MRIARPISVCFGLLLLLSQPMAPAVITVSGACNLQAAIASANADDFRGGCSVKGSGADTIVLTGNVLLDEEDHIHPEDGANGLPSVTSEITIEGDGFSVARDLFTAPPFRIFHVSQAGYLTLEDLTVSFGIATKGGGIFNNGTLVLLNSTVGPNRAEAPAGVVYGGGIYGGGEAGDPFRSVTVLKDSRLVYNTAAGDTTARGGGVSAPFGFVSITNSTVSGNAAEAAFFPSGGGVHSLRYMAIENSTISGNSATRGVAGYSRGGGVYGEGRLIHVTLSGNEADVGAAAFGTDLLWATGSLFANSSGDHCGGAFYDYGMGNLADNSSCVPTIDGSLEGLDPVLRDNGGPTWTHALDADSTAVGIAGACGFTSDQRGAGRELGCDSGAFEAVSLCETEDREISGAEIEIGCRTHIVGPDVTILGPFGGLSVTAGYLITIKNGVEVREGGELVLTLDPAVGRTAI